MIRKLVVNPDSIGVNVTSVMGSRLAVQGYRDESQVWAIPI